MVRGRTWGDYTVGAEEKKKITRRRRMGRSGAMRMTPKLREIALERST